MERATRNSERGLTIFELMIVMMVIAIIASISIATLAAALDRSKQRATMADMRVISRAIEAYLVDNSRIPDSRGGLEAVEALVVPAMVNVLPLKDHWGNAIDYVADGGTNYTLISFGKDGVRGEDYSREESRNYDGDLVMRNGTFVAAPQ